MQTSRFRREPLNVVINLRLGPDDEHMAFELAASRVISFLPRFELTAYCLKFHEMDAREAVCGPNDDTIWSALRRRVELLAHPTMQFDLLDEILLDFRFLHSAFDFTG